MTFQRGRVDKAHRLLAPRVAYLVGTVDGSGVPDLIPVSNVTSVSTAPEQVLLAVYKAWTTYANLSSGEGFTLSLPTAAQADGVWKLGARYSKYPVTDPAGKLAGCGLNVVHEPGGYGPTVTGCLGFMACRTVRRIDTGGDHGIFIGEVEAVCFDDATFTDDGVPKQEFRPVMQVTGNTFTTAGSFFSLDYLGT